MPLTPSKQQKASACRGDSWLCRSSTAPPTDEILAVYKP
ncbi:hypothetical protein ACP70R_017949 [Stipagrostis hirtigluma subsp. patula]